MIWESYYWKEDLLRQAKHLTRKKSQYRWPEASLAKVEQIVMLGFYSVRKLMEASKVSNDLIESLVSINMYPSKGKSVTLLNWHKLDQLYDRSKPTRKKVDIKWISNIFIHSYIFMTIHEDNGGLAGISINSDRTRNEALFEVRIDDIINIFISIGKDYPALFIMKFSPAIGDYEVLQTSTAGPTANKIMKHQEEVIKKFR